MKDLGAHTAKEEVTWHLGLARGIKITIPYSNTCREAAQALRQIADTLESDHDRFEKDYGMKAEGELRFKEKTVTLTNQDLVEWAHTVKEIIEIMVEHKVKLFWEQANCYSSMFCTCKEMLEKYVDPEYLDEHVKLKVFYLQSRSLDRTGDVLSWRYHNPIAEALSTI